jgi:hypothetical protein
MCAKEFPRNVVRDLPVNEELWNALKLLIPALGTANNEDQ